jgi:hypothetical protein
MKLPLQELGSEGKFLHPSDPDGSNGQTSVSGATLSIFCRFVDRFGWPLRPQTHQTRWERIYQGLKLIFGK